MCECVCTHACVCSFRTKGRCGMPSSIALSFTLSRKGFLLYLSAPFQVEQPASTQAPSVSACHLWGCRHAMPGFLTWVLGIQTRLLMLATGSRPLSLLRSPRLSSFAKVRYAIANVFFRSFAVTTPIKATGAGNIVFRQHQYAG